MNCNKLAVTAFALSALASGAALAADTKPGSMDKKDMAAMEKCYGVALAGKNDCAAGRAPPAPARPRRTIRPTPGKTCPRAPAPRSRRRRARAAWNPMKG